MTPFRQIGRLRWYVLGCLLCFLQQTARADLWAHVDERGVTHFAAEQVDARYQLFFRGNDFDSTRDTPVNALPMPYALPAAGARLLAFFDIAPDYKRVKHHLRAASSQHGVDYELLQAVIATESGFDAAAVSPKGAVGLMQLMPDTAKRYGVTNLTDPDQNIEGGTRYLKDLIEMFTPNLELAVAAYNAGENAVIKYNYSIPPYPETQNYVKQVLSLYDKMSL